MGDIVARLTDEEKKNPVAVCNDDEEILYLSNLEIADEDLFVPSGDNIDQGAPYLS